MLEEISEKYGVDRSTPGRRWRRVTPVSCTLADARAPLHSGRPGTNVPYCVTEKPVAETANERARIASFPTQCCVLLTILGTQRGTSLHP
jgi:hypothetical protein